MTGSNSASGSAQCPIVLDDDDEMNFQMSSHKDDRAPMIADTAFESLENDQDFLEDSYESLFETTSPHSSCHIPFGSTIISELALRDFKRQLRPGVDVELTNGTFMRISNIFLTPNYEYIIKGKPFQFNSMASKRLPHHLGEVCCVLTNGEKNAWVRSVKRVRPIIMTNRPFPDLNVKVLDKNDNGALVCRWALDHNASSNEECYRRLRYNECDPGENRHDDKGLQLSWTTSAPGYQQSSSHRALSLGHSQQLQSPRIRTQGSFRRQPYTLGDGFSGAGGISEGARQAGLFVQWGFDHNASAIRTFKMNHPNAQVYYQDVHEFVISPGCKYCDILHISPPCQFFSPCHTRNGINDEKNESALFSVQALLRTVRPRVATLEQTFGIEATKHADHFNELISMFTAENYSVRWKRINFQTLGSPQTRKRVIIIASCIGEKLPNFPRATHSQSGLNGLERIPSVHSILSTIPKDHPDQLKPTNFRTPKPAWNAKKPGCGTITAGSSGSIYHPSGLRPFSLLEQKLLQGFPLNYRFSKEGQQTQIGNAVPPPVAKAIYESIIQSLRESDES